MRHTPRITATHSAARRRGLAAGVLTACVLLATACNGDSGEPETPPGSTDTDGTSADSGSPATDTTTGPPTGPPTGPSTTSPGTPSSPPADDEGQARTDAESVVRDYAAFTDDVIADDTITLDRLDAFLQNPELTEQRDYFANFRDQGFYSNGGATVFESIRATSTSVDTGNRSAEVTLRACRNFDDVDVRDESGQRVETISPSLATYQVFNYDYPSPTGWRIAVEDSSGTRCRP